MQAGVEFVWLHNFPRQSSQSLCVPYTRRRGAWMKEALSVHYHLAYPELDIDKVDLLMELVQ